jgi:Tfp pilus assembly protein PilW
LNPEPLGPAPDARDAGASLVEMVTTVGLLGVVMAVVMAGVIAFTRLSGNTEDRMRNLEEARTIMAVLTKDLRTATPATASGARVDAFVTTQPTEVVFYANQRSSPGSPTDPTLPVSAAPLRVRLRLETDPANPARRRLIQEVTQPTGSGNNITWPSTPTRSRVVGTNIRNDTTTGNALFCYDNAAAAATPPVETSFCSTATPAPAAIANVRVRLQVQRADTQGVTVLTSSVWLPNVAAEAVTT